MWEIHLWEVLGGHQASGQTLHPPSVCWGLRDGPLPRQNIPPSGVASLGSLAAAVRGAGGLKRWPVSHTSGRGIPSHMSGSSGWLWQAGASTNLPQGGGHTSCGVYIWGMASVSYGATSCPGLSAWQGCQYPAIGRNQSGGIEFQLKVWNKNTTSLINSGPILLSVNSEDLG